MSGFGSAFHDAIVNGCPSRQDITCEVQLAGRWQRCQDADWRGKRELKWVRKSASLIENVTLPFVPRNAREDVSAMVLSFPGIEAHRSGEACRFRSRSANALRRKVAIWELEAASRVAHATVGVLSE